MLGVLSLMIWSLVLVVTVKYLVFVMRADNHGEGGILALTALITPPTGDAEVGSAGASCCWGCSAPRCSTATA